MMTNSVGARWAGRGARTLLLGCAVCALLLVASVVAQAQGARSGDKPIDFVFAVPAESATFTPIEGEPGVYRLVLRGVPAEVGVHELHQARTGHSFRTALMMHYWTRYGDETSGFAEDPPVAVLRGTDGEAADDAVVVELRNGSRRGSTLTFEADVETRSQVLRLMKSKIARTIEHQIGALEHVRRPTRMRDVTMHIDMPKADDDPQAATRAATSMLQTPVRSTRAMTCNGNYSSQLVACWDVITAGTQQCYGNQSYLEVNFPYWDDRGFVYEGVGLVDLGDWYFEDFATPRFNVESCSYPFNWGDLYGVNWNYDAATYVASSRCSYFLARWNPNGRCY